jgi:hypothetical protein
LVPGTWITADLRDSADQPLPMQVTDSLLTDEVVTPSGASVEILDATRVGDMIEIKLDVKNFTAPSRDEPVPGRGWANVLDARGLRPIEDFHAVDNDITRLTGPAWRLGGVTDIVVALHYANGSRVRPLAADTVKASIALLDRASLPSVKIASHETDGTAIKINFTLANFTTDMHVHVYKDEVNAPEYMLCRGTSCSIQPDVWTGAKRLIAVVVNPDHSIFTPQSRDTLNAPF